MILFSGRDHGSHLSLREWCIRKQLRQWEGFSPARQTADEETHDKLRSCEPVSVDLAVGPNKPSSREFAR